MGINNKNTTSTSRAAIVRGFDQLIADLGGDPLEVINATGIKLEQVNNPETRLPSSLITDVLSQSARISGCEHFGLELGRQRDLSIYLGLIGEVAQSAATLGDALSEIIKLFNLHSDASLWQLKREGEIAYVIYSLVEDSSGGYRQVEQLVITIFCRFMDLLTEGKWHPSMVNFTFRNPENTKPYRRTFNASIVFDADFCGVVFHSSDLDIEPAKHNKAKHSELHQRALNATNSVARNFSEEVRRLIRKNLELQLVGEEYLTPFFPFEKRTLQRKLNSLGTSYQQLLHDVRIAMAMELLANSDISITRLADRLCYTDLANFSKVFCEHTGTPPSVWRAQIISAFDDD